MCKRNWYWFIISVVLCLCCGYFYILRTQPTYTRTASFVIQDDQKGTTLTSDITSSFSNLGISTARSDIFNEIFVVKSPVIVSQVVKDLNLTVSYHSKGLLRNATLYGSNLPYTVNTVEEPEYPFSFTITNDEDGARLTDFVSYTDTGVEEFDDELKFNATGVDTVATPVGKVVIRPNSKFTGDITKPVKEVVNVGLFEPTVDAIIAGITAEQPEEHASIIELSYTDTSTERAEDIINTLIDDYNKAWVENRNQMARATSQFINERLAVIEQELGSVDSDISNFKAEHLIPDPQAVTSIYLNQMNATSDELLELNNKLQMARYIKEYIDNPKNDFKVLPTNTGVGNASLETMIVEYNKAVIERNQMLSASSEKNPLVQDYTQRLMSARQAISSSVQNQIVGLSQSINNYTASQRQTTSKIAANPNQTKHLLSIERQQKVKESLYLFLLQKREENEVGQTFAPYYTRILSQARGTGIPTAPRRGNILMVSFLMGLLIPFAVIYIRFYLNNTVRGKKDLENMPIPFVGEIPLDTTGEPCALRLLGIHRNKNLGIVVKHGTTDIVGESFRTIRYNISLMLKQLHLLDKGKVMMVTSAYPGSGKTFVSENLGGVFALKGGNARVLIIDFDIRRHTLSDNLLGKNPQQGITTLLLNENEDPDDVTIHEVNGMKRLSLIPAGPVPPNPTEILESPRLAEIITMLRSEYDYIILDCPPIEAVADAKILTRITDITIFVVRVGLMKREYLNELTRIYQSKQFTRLSLLLNGSKLGSGNRYGYAYGYSYNESDITKK